MMYGYWMGPDETGVRRLGRWVLVRDEKEFPRGWAAHDEARKPNNDPPAARVASIG